MRLDHLLSMEKRGWKTFSENELQVQLQERDAKAQPKGKTLVIALFNFEGTSIAQREKAA